MLELGPAASRFIDLVQGAPADALAGPTPCTAFSVGDLLDHCARFPVALRAAATKEALDGPGGPGGHVADLLPDWQTAIPAMTEELVEVWKSPSAWEGMTTLAGLELPAETVGNIAVGELILHGWDLAVATGQTPGYDGPHLEELYAMCEGFQALGIPGVFDSPVVVPDSASLYDRVLGISGRDPGWSA